MDMLGAVSRDLIGADLPIAARASCGEVGGKAYKARRNARLMISLTSAAMVSRVAKMHLQGW